MSMFSMRYEQLRERLENTQKRLLNLGRESATAITGDPDDAKDIGTIDQAFAAIEAEIKYGRAAWQLLTQEQRSKVKQQ